MNNETILIIGANGQLGRALQAHYPGAKSADIDTLDITDEDSVTMYDWSGITTILNAAAYTNVDGAETNEGRIAAWKVNAVSTSYLAKIAAARNITMVHISTDYVFDGEISEHTETEPFSPLSVYGSSKAAGDLSVITNVPKFYLIRTSWVVGDGKNFVKTMKELAEKNISPTVVHDQIGRLTFTNELVRAIDFLITKKAVFGIYNVTNEGEPSSWADITREIFTMLGRNDLKVTDTTTESYFEGKQGIAVRPLKSTLNLNKIQSLGFKSVDWKTALKNYIMELSK